MAAITRGPWPDRPATDQRCVGYLWVPTDELFLPAVEEVTRAALLTAGRTVHPTPALVTLVRDLAADLLARAVDGRSWLLELETDDSDLFVRLWVPMRDPGPVRLDPTRTAGLEACAGSYHLDQNGDQLLVVVQLELHA